MIGYNLPIQTAATNPARALFGIPPGPPFRDPALQRTYEFEWRKLSESSIAISDETAQSLVAAVMRSALAAGESAIPKIERRVRRKVLQQIPRIKREVRREVLKQLPRIKTTAKAGAVGGVTKLLLGGAVLTVIGLGAYATFRATGK